MRWPVKIKSHEDYCLPGPVLIRSLRELQSCTCDIEGEAFPLVARNEANRQSIARLWKKPSAVVLAELFHANEKISLSLRNVKFSHQNPLACCMSLDRLEIPLLQRSQRFSLAGKQACVLGDSHHGEDLGEVRRQPECVDLLPRIGSLDQQLNHQRNAA